MGPETQAPLLVIFHYESSGGFPRFLSPKKLFLSSESPAGKDRFFLGRGQSPLEDGCHFEYSFEDFKKKVNWTFWVLQFAKNMKGIRLRLLKHFPEIWDQEMLQHHPNSTPVYGSNNFTALLSDVFFGPEFRLETLDLPHHKGRLTPKFDDKIPKILILKEDTFSKPSSLLSI